MALSVIVEISHAMIQQANHSLDLDKQLDAIRDKCPPGVLTSDFSDEYLHLLKMREREFAELGYVLWRSMIKSGVVK